MTTKTEQYAGLPFLTVSCGSGTQHLVYKTPQGVIATTLCGRRWLHRTTGPFNAKLDCEKCRKIQEDRA